MLSIVLFFGSNLASGFVCFWPAVSGAYVGCAVCAVSAAFIVGSPSAVTACPAPALAVQGVWSQSFVPSCCSCLLSSLGVSSAAFCHLGLLSHPILLLFLAGVSSFDVYSGLGLRCCGPGYGSSLLLGGSLSLVLVLAWLLQLFRFVQLTWVSWTSCWVLFSLDFQCSAGSSEWVEINVSVLSCLLFGCALFRTIL